MYPEFIIIYVMLAIVIALLGVAIFFLLRLTKNGGGSSYSPAPQQEPTYNNDPYQQYQQNYAQSYASQGGVVFCQKCATQYDASQGYCPRCGARR